MSKWAEIWWEAPMEGSVLSFLKAECKVIDTGSAQCWASSFSLTFVRQIIRNWKFGNNNQTYPILIDWLMFGHRGHHRKKSLKISKHLYTNIFYHVSQRYIDINWTRDGFQFSIDNPYIVLATVADIDTLSIQNWWQIF
jgi:hypothetical protein